MNRVPLRELAGLVRALAREMIVNSPREAALGTVVLLILTATEGVGLLLLAPLLELVGVVDESPLPRAGGWLESGLATLGVEPTLGSVLLLFIGIAGVRALMQRLHAQLNATLRENLTAAVRIRVYRAMAAAQWKFLVTRPPSQFVHVLISEAGRVGGAASQLSNLAVVTLAALVYLALAIRLSPEIAGLVLACAAVLGWAARGSIDRSRTFAALAADNRGRLHAAIAEHVSSMKVAKAYGATDRHEDIVVELSGVSAEVMLKVTAGETNLQQTLEFGSTVLLALIVYVSATYFDVPSALLLVMLFIFARLMPRLVAVYRHVQGLAATLPVFNSVRQLEEECRAAAEAVSATPVEVGLARSIRFENVSFAYLRRGETEAVSGLAFEIEAGRTTAIVGPSGSGKSTVADLLLGLLAPDAGQILIDGVPLTAEGLASWRRQIAFVPQDTFLFHATVRDNLLWASPEADEAAVWEALRMAAADQFVAALPQGMDTIIGERGVLLSGGERQRLAVARALLRHPRVLVLDEATSSLDTENELRIQHAIEALHDRMTIVVITHRLSTIRNADVIHVMADGRIVRSGKWDTLGLEAAPPATELARP